LRLYFFIILLLVLTAFNGRCQTKTYSDSKGGKIVLPLGSLSFADEVVAYKKGLPMPISGACDSTLALNEPNYAGVAGNFTSLGCAGSLILRFNDNVLINVPGADLFVFEVGKFVETTQLEISKDGISWIKVGEISGGTTSVDIGPFVKNNEVFHYVKLTDLKTECRGKWPGADIDAVAAIGAGKLYNLNSSVLFKVNEFALINDSKNELDKVIEYINSSKPSKIIIEGHTDSTGTSEFNQQLSEKRANSVSEYILSKCVDYKNKIDLLWYGSSQPIASNNSEQGKERNRRVSIILIP